MRNLRSKLSYSNLMATAAMFIALGGVSYAAMTLPKNSVGTSQLRNQAVSTAKIRDGAITGSKVDLSSLGSVPKADRAASAEFADHATNADSATSSSFAGSAAKASDARTLEGQEVSAFGTVLLAHMNIPPTAVPTRQWGSVTGIAPTASSAEDVEMVTPYHSDLVASDFTVFSREGSGETGHVDVRLFVNGVATELSCFVPRLSECINPPTTKVHVPGGSWLAISVHEEPEGSEIPAFPLEVSLRLSPAPLSK